jgi:hypothetical protein
MPQPSKPCCVPHGWPIQSRVQVDPLQRTWVALNSSSCRDTVHANLWVSFPRRSSRLRRTTPRLTGSYSRSTRVFAVSAVCWRAGTSVFTDHKHLMHAISRIFDPWTACQCRQLAYIPEYTSNTQHVAGVFNMVSGTLSRPLEPVAHAMCRVHLHIRSLLAAIMLEMASGLHLCSSDQVHSHSASFGGST